MSSDYSAGWNDGFLRACRIIAADLADGMAVEQLLDLIDRLQPDTEDPR